MNIKKDKIIATIDDWNVLANELIPTLKPGMVLTLSGQLGAGKTTFVQALAKELGSQDKAKSPTFALMRIYKTSHPLIKRIVHVDAYRIDDERDVVTLNLDEELSEPGTLLVVEWPEQIKNWLKKKDRATTALLLYINPKGERFVEIRSA